MVGEFGGTTEEVLTMLLDYGYREAFCLRSLHVIHFPIMLNTPEKLCDVCLGEGRKICPFQVIIERGLAMREGAKDLAVTPSPLGGNDAMAKWLQGVTDADDARLRQEAEERGCTIFTPPPAAS